MLDTKLIMDEISSIKSIMLHLLHNRANIEDWLPENVVMRFFNYGKTQMRSLEKRENLIISKIGNRKFYNKQSIIVLIEKNIEKCLIIS